MPNHNGGKFIEKSILSFVDNQYTNKELIIVDSKSSDDSHTIIKKYSMTFESIKWLNNSSDRGISEAINNGIELAEGEIIGYLGSDDLLNSETLFKINNYKQLCNFDAVYFDSYTYFFEENRIKLRKCPNIEFNLTNLIKYGTIVGLQNIFFDKRVFEMYKFNVNNKYSMDYEIYLRVIKRFTCFIYIEYPATINIFHNNISNRPSKLQSQEAMKSLLCNVRYSEYIHIPLKKIAKYLVRRYIVKTK
jgi:glycosyltransferase involved in cell wall biosynthesis